LNVGDYAWIARERSNFGLKPRELVLKPIVERKRLDDLKSSVFDGRYKEQKIRLSSCGVNSVVYLIEEYDKHKSKWNGASFNLDTVESILMSTATSQR